MTAALQNSPMVKGDRSNDMQRLRAVRKHVTHAPNGTMMGWYDGSLCLLADDPMTGDNGVIARFEPQVSNETVESLADTIGDLKFVLGLLDRAIATIRTLRAAGNAQPTKSDDAAETRKLKIEPGTNYAAQAQMKCQDPSFSTFLVARYGMADGDDPANHIREILDIPSRVALNAAGKWKRLALEHDLWKQGNG